MAKEVYRIEIPIETTDNYSDGLKKAEKDVKGFENTTKKAGKSTKDLGDSSDKAAKGVEKFGGSSRKAEKEVSKFQSGVQKTRDRLREMTARKWQLTVSAVDRASKVISSINSFTHRIAGRSYRFTIRAIDMASSAIRGIHRGITSIPAMVTVVLSVVGINKLQEATVGAAMNFEQYEVSMTHWLDGNTKKAKELIGWMGQFADTTPFSSPDLFPALVEGVNITDGNISNAQRYLKIASDMSALTPGRSVEDAMQALKNVKMGEYSMVSGFGFDLNKKAFDKMGWSGFIDQIEKRFKDGAKKLSETSIGIIATLKGYRGSILRTLGDGILLPMKPRLDAINKWLANNQETWGRWKNTVKTAGNQASEWMFSRLENGFGYIKTNYLENDEFKNMSFEGKVDFVLADINEWWSSKAKPALDGWWDSTGKPWAAKIGLTIGEAIFEGIKLGITTGLSSIGEMWKDVGSNAQEHGIFSKETAGSVGGAAVATLGAGAIGTMLLSPILKGGKKIWDGGRWSYDKAFGRGKKTPPVMSPDDQPSSGKRKPPAIDGEKKISAPTKSSPVILDQYGKPLPPSGSAPTSRPTIKPEPRVEPKSKGFKMPKGLRGLRGVPVLGALLGGASLFTAPKEEMPGTVGSISGGLGGAAAGAALGSVVPVVGTAIGGIIGGIFGALGGQALGDWLSDNWSLIKAGASSTGKWISKKFTDSVDWISDTWGGFTGWFSNSVWEPVSEGARGAVRWIQDKWAAITGWFSARIWKPFTKGFDTALNFVVGLYDIAEGLIKASWGAVSFWFSHTVWTPLKKIAETTWSWISTKASYAWTGINVLWGLAASWFSEKVWTPITTTASNAWDWITKTIDNAWLGVQMMWGVAVAWFQNTIWTPLMSAAGVVGTWIGSKFTEGWNAVTSIWSVATGWFEDTIWSPIKEGAGVLGTWIGEKFTEGWNSVVTIWGVASGYFEENIWTPIKIGAAAVKDAIITPFEEAWGVVSGIFTKLGDTWDTIKQWGGKAVEWTDQATDYVVERGKQRRARIPEYARGTNFHPGGLAIVGDGGGPELILYPSGGMSLSPGTDTLMNLPRGTEVLSHRETKRFMSEIPAYKDGIGFNDSPSSGMTGVKPYTNGGLVGTEPLVPGYGDSALAIAGTMGGVIKSESRGAIHVSAPISVQVDGGGSIDEKQIRDIVVKYSKEFVDKLKEALRNRSR